jgi:hypothetical protein
MREDRAGLTGGVKKKCDESRPILGLLLRQLNLSGFVVPAEAGIQGGAGCPRIGVRGRRIKSGMTALAYLVAGQIRHFYEPQSNFSPAGKNSPPNWDFS